MKNAKTILLTDKVFFWSFSIIVLCSIVTAASLLIFYQKFPPLVPLFNQMPWGESRLAPTPFIFLPFGISILLLLINFVIAFWIYQQLPLVARILAITSFLITLLTLLLTVRTLQLIV